MMRFVNCEECVFLSSVAPSFCRKVETLNLFKESCRDNDKIVWFLNWQLSLLRRAGCRVEVSELSDSSVTEFRRKVFDDFNTSIKHMIVAVECLSFSVIRRKYSLPSSPVLVRAYCRYKKCLKRYCRVRGRGRRCPNQLHLNSVLEAV